MNVTLILCTYNRCDGLAATLESIAASRVPDSVSWEALVVDNNSRDQTREVVEEFVARFPGRFRYLFEPKQGKSHALNAGIRAACGDILAFVDDDVTVEPKWLDELTSVLSNQQWAGVGGRILPAHTFTAPRWLSLANPYALAPLAMFDLGRDARELMEPPFGTNMAFRKEMFSRYGDFRLDLGPQPGSEIRSEDTEFGWRLLRAGERLYYEPAAVVYHSIPSGRVTQSYFLNWWHGKGRADIREFGVDAGTRWFVAGVPLYLIRRCVAWGVRWVLAVRPRSRFTAKQRLWTTLGALKECRDQFRRRNPGVSNLSATHPQL